MSNTRSPSVSTQSRTTSRSVSYTILGSIATPPQPFIYRSQPAPSKRRLQSVTTWTDRVGIPSRFVFACLQFLRFGCLELVSCLFPAFLFAGLAISKYVELPIARYDALLIYCLGLTFLLGRPAGDVARGGGDLRVPPGRTRARTVQGAGRLLAVPG